MQNNTGNQHFVPVCYLKNFSPESEYRKKNPKVWAYDKFSNISKFIGVKSICFSHKLYSINSTSESLITNDITDKETIFESHYLHDFEQEYSPKLKNAIVSIKNRKFGGENKMDISVFIALQYLRDPILKYLCDSIAGLPYLALPHEYKLLSDNIPEFLNDPSMRHFMYAYGNREAISTLTRSLALSEWTIHYNDNDVFFTSDNPVCLAEDKKMNSQDNRNIDKKLNILFPLSKNILLQIRQGIQIDSVFFIDNTPQWQIDNFNFVQAFFAKKYIVSPTDTFTSIISRLNEFPRTWDKNKLNIYG